MEYVWGKTYVNKICARGRERLGNVREAERMQVRHDFREFRVIGIFCCV
jgi:hypothetical protein